MKGASLSLSLDSADGTLKMRLAEESLDALQIEVRWGYQDGREYLHGVKFKDVSQFQTAFIVERLCEYALDSRTSKRGLQLGILLCLYSAFLVNQALVQHLSIPIRFQNQRASEGEEKPVGTILYFEKG